MRVKLAAIKDLLFSNRTLRQTVAKNAFWLTAGNVTGRLIKAALIIYVARELGASGYGVFSYAVGLAGFFSIFSDVGVSGILTREVTRNPAAMPEYLATSLTIKIGLLLATNVIIFTVAPHFSANVPEAVALLPLAALLITADGLREVAFSITRAKEKMQTEAGLHIITNVAITILGIAAVFWRPTPFTLMAGYSLGSVCGTIAAYWLLRKDFHSPWRYFRKDLVAPIFKEGFPYALLGILGTLMLNTDILLLGWLAPGAETTETLGIYSAAQRPVQVLYIIPTILGISIFPALARLARESGERFTALLERAVAAAFLIGLPLTVGGLAVSGNLMLLLFGPEFLSGTAAFMVLLLTILVVFPGNFVTNAVFASDSEKAFYGYMALGAIANIVLDLMLIPIFGMLGCAIATLAAQILANFVTWRKMRSIRPFRVLRNLPRMLAATLIMGAAATALGAIGLPVLLIVAACGTLYVALLFLFKEPLLAYVPR